MKKLLLFLFTVFVISGLQAQTSPLTEDQKIDLLIAFVKNQKDAVFIRNGVEHTAPKAAEHLQMKRARAGSRITTARDFINYVASKSSVSGKPYYIKIGNGKTLTSEEVLLKELERIEKR